MKTMSKNTVYSRFILKTIEYDWYQFSLLAINTEATKNLSQSYVAINVSIYLELTIGNNNVGQTICRHLAIFILLMIVVLRGSFERTP